ncbi:hypothetical protein E1B28_005715 [Marasmius oreades]|uniref:Uncharacterized protein n=1 Tax=Marasmius oreades TaxID=181124 RepID=A0A9P7UW86_9AGAR|nr:uncharacterized protein E1B28_005715 [Marasmius oreades]KAG7094909.1 hypothetical protein E1B28_005715 [Marasmius oreades]
MRFSSTFVALAATFGLVVSNPLEVRQEAARFGSVNVNPSTVAPGGTLKIRYNATTARSHPLFVDFSLQGKFDNGNDTPRLVLSRNDFGPNEVILDANIKLPPVETLGDTNSWLVLAFVTYPQDGFILTGGTSAPVSFTSA